MSNEVGDKAQATLLIIALLTSFVLPILSFPQKAHAAATVIFLTSGTSWTVPSDWDSSNNTIEVIGGGGGGDTVTSVQNVAGGGGGGGGYSSISNLTLTPSDSVTYQVGTGGAAENAGGDTYLCNVLNSGGSCDAIGDAAVQVGAKGGGGATSVTGVAGGASGSGVGTVKSSGGTGGTGWTSVNGGGGGGGGAAGPNGNGGNGSTNLGFKGGDGGGGANGGSNAANCGSDSGCAGGNNRLGSGGGSAGGGNGSNGGGGGGGTTGGNGGAGSQETIWTQTSDSATAGPGAGGGGGGGFGASGGHGGAAGGYGGGGSGAGDTSGITGNGGAGTQGIIVITYTPLVLDAPTNLTTTSTTGAVSLSWTAPASTGGSNLQTYGIWRATAPFTATTSATIIASFATSTGTTYSDTSAVRGTIYFYRVTATNSTATSSLSNERTSSSNSGRIVRLKGMRLR